MRVIKFLFFGIVLFLPFSVVVSAEDSEEVVPSTSKIKITEVKLGGMGDVKEYVTLYNVSDESVDLDGWMLEYAKTTFDSSFCNSSSWAENSVSGSASDIALSGTLPPQTVSSPVERSLTDNSAGSLRVIDADLVVHDLVGWGESAPCFEANTAPQPASSTSSAQSITRFLNCTTSEPIDTDNNLADIGLSDAPTPGLINNLLHPDCSSDTNEDEETEGGIGGGDGEAVNSCEGVIISELLPNPAGADSGNEFIELYNPTSKTISLFDCSLQTSSNSKIFKFGQQDIKSGQYIAFYDDQTGLTLANSAGGTVYLIDADDTEIYQVDYQADLDDDVAWAFNFSTNKWSLTYTESPNEANQIVTVKPCPVGQFRNLETNRCNTIVVEAGLESCPVGKERNPETNRCRNITSLSSILKACSADQVRNPETNRCKKINSGSTLTPCKSDQVRNPETNRCRKNTDVLNSSDQAVKDVITETDAGDQLSWMVASASFIGAMGYGVWEWRNEMLEKLLMLKSRFL